MSYHSPEDKIYIKIYLSGDNAVGKNSFIQRYRDKIHLAKTLLDCYLHSSLELSNIVSINILL